MANLPGSGSQTSVHLSDRALNPLISSSQDIKSSTSSPEQAQALASLTSTAITVYDSASGLRLGLPLRVMIETRGGPAVLHSFLSPQNLGDGNGGARGIVESTREDLRPLSKGTDSSAEEEVEQLVEDEDDEESSRTRAPLLIATVVLGSTASLGEAKMTAAKLERVGREFQKEWTREQLEENEAADENESV